MRLQLSPIEESDLDKIVEISFRAHEDDWMWDAIFGPDTPASRTNTKKRFLKGMTEDRTDVWHKVTDIDTGRLIAAANWKIYPTYVAAGEGHESTVDWFEGEEKEAAEYLVKDFLDRRRRRCKEAHVLLYNLFTDLEYRRHGAGSMMVKWGCDLADRLFLPMWVESSVAGHRLYLQNGFEDVEDVNTKKGKYVSHYFHMKRPQKVSKMVGRSLEMQ